MHRLDLTPSQREHFEQLGALTISATGYEVLQGLTPLESEYLVRCSVTPPDDLSEPEKQRYAELVVKHEKARLQGLAFAACAKNEASLG